MLHQCKLIIYLQVETISDTYVVASGLPEENGHLHAQEIARVALALRNAVKCSTIRHMPNRKVLLLQGMNSGECVGAIIGLKMPRYCLFGDTMNTASRMESTSEGKTIVIPSALLQVGKY